MNSIEPVADAVTGGRVAGAAEPPVRGPVGSDGHTEEQSCLNCGTDLIGHYCHDCGQRAHVHRSLGAFGHDLLHGVFHFEGKIWRTLPMLVLRPGELTRRYIEGQRASFVSPIALFLFGVFLMFAVLSIATATTTGSIDSRKVEAGLSEEIREADGRIATLERQRAAAARAGQATAELDRRLKDERQGRGLLKTMHDQGLVKGTAVRLSDDVPDWLRDPIEKAGKNPELLLFKLKSHAYKFSWMLIPLSVPFVWLLFPFSRRFRLYDHTVFVTYSLCFVTLLVIAANLWSRTGLPGGGLPLLLLPPLHMYRQLKGAYELTRAAALWRTILLMIFSAIAGMLFLLILLGLGIFD